MTLTNVSGAFARFAHVDESTQHRFRHNNNARGE
jgi:hypothetical protein